MSQEISFSGAVNSDHFLLIFFIVVVSFILITIWSNFIEIMYYDFLGFDKKSAADALLLAGFLTFLIFTVGYMVRTKLKTQEIK